MRPTAPPLYASFTRENLRRVLRIAPDVTDGTTLSRNARPQLEMRGDPCPRPVRGVMFAAEMPRPSRFPILSGADATVPYRRLILALIAIGAGGLLTELLLIEHYDESWQWAPLVALGLTLAGCAMLAARPGPGTLRAFRVVMSACLVLGAIGVILHLKGNLEFELEGAPGLSGWPLYREVLKGATPALAPGALAQLGLLGLLYAYRHPAAAHPAAHARTNSQESA